MEKIENIDPFRDSHEFPLHKRKYVTCLLVLCILILIPIVSHYIYYEYIRPCIVERNRQNKLNDYIEIIKNNINNKEFIMELSQNNRGGLINIDDKNWVAIISHDFHQKGYDLTIFIDNKGSILESRHHYCGGVRGIIQSYDSIKKNIEQIENDVSLNNDKYLNSKIIAEEKEKLISRFSVIAIVAKHHETEDMVLELIERKLFTRITISIK